MWSVTVTDPLRLAAAHGNDPSHTGGVGAEAPHAGGSGAAPRTGTVEPTGFEPLSSCLQIMLITADTYTDLHGHVSAVTAVHRG
jgi:hypothetical protein